MVMMLAGRLEIFPVLYVVGRITGALPGGSLRRVVRRTTTLAPTTGRSLGWPAMTDRAQEN